MALSTYTELQAAVADFLARDDLTATIPTFIALAEAQLQRDVRHWRMISRASLVSGGQYTDLPADWVETVRLTLDGRPLTLMSWAEMARRREETEDAAGDPTYYAHLGGELETWPSSTATTDTFELTYVQAIPSLAGELDETNWLLATAPDAYLYGTLLQAAPYLSEDERTAVWAGLYAAAVAALNRTSDAAAHSGSPLRVRPPR